MSKIIQYTDYAIIQIDSEKFGLHEFKIDLDDVKRCSEITWSVFNGGRTGYKGKFFYAIYSDKGNGKLLHRFLLNATSDFVVDHVNGDTKDNRKQNLRICSKKLNCQNRRNINKNNTSGHKGVTKYNNKKSNLNWMAYIHINNKFINLGYFEKLEDAIEARKQAELKFYGEYRSQRKNKQK